MHVSVIIPAFNEEKSIAKVIHEIPKELVQEIVVVNNNSIDETARIAKQAGAIVIDENKAGYGNACLKGIDYLQGLVNQPAIVVFLDGDLSDYPIEMSKLVDEIIDNDIDFVVGSRSLGNCEKGSMTPQQLIGNKLATFLIKVFFHYSYTDLGPFRAIKFDKLLNLSMCDKNFGWTVEMQIKAIKQKLVIKEIPINYRQRIGVSKVSGTIKGTILAGIKIIYTIFKYI